jgi:hypothetical protein
MWESRHSYPDGYPHAHALFAKTGWTGRRAGTLRNCLLLATNKNYGRIAGWSRSRRHLSRLDGSRFVCWPAAWRVTSVDRARRIAYVEPTLVPGPSTRLGSSKGLIRDVPGNAPDPLEPDRHPLWPHHREISSSRRSRHPRRRRHSPPTNSNRLRMVDLCRAHGLRRMPPRTPS